MPEDAKENDKAYAPEAAKAVGRLFADIFKGMREGGMSDHQAERALHVYVVAFVGQKPEPKEDKDA